MANFKTHLAVGIVASGMLSTITMAASIVPPNQVVTLALCGALGSVLPDIDLQNSRASQALFTGLGIFLAFALLFNVSWKYSIAEMWIVWIATFLTVRYVVTMIFHKYAVHRGVFHSLIAGFFFACTTSAIFFHLFKASPTQSWLAGTFIFVGYIVHLLLDEIYSVDFHGNRVKRSFGTALKIFDGRYPAASFAMTAAMIAVFVVTPPLGAFWSVVGSQEVWAFLGDRLLPEEAWFGLIATSAEKVAMVVN